MVTVINVPHATNDKVKIDWCMPNNNTVEVRVFDAPGHTVQSATGAGRSLQVASLWLGDHCLPPVGNARTILFQQIGDAMVSCIVKGRERGYDFAQQDIRRALGVKG
jgi:hypothetical protein